MSLSKLKSGTSRTGPSKFPSMAKGPLRSKTSLRVRGPLRQPRR